MTEFSLSRRRELVFPNYIENDDRAKLKIRPGHQTILKIFRLLEDEDIQEHHRIAKACDLFFVAPIDMLAGYALLIRFLNYGEMPDENEPNHRPKRLICFEQDAPEIYASFLQIYGIDLIETDLHWYRFNALLSAMLRVDNPLAAKLQLRTLDTGKLKGRDKRRAEAAKQSVAIRERISGEDQRLEQQLIEAIQNGGNVAEILKQRA